MLELWQSTLVMLVKTLVLLCDFSLPVLLIIGQYLNVFSLWQGNLSALCNWSVVVLVEALTR